jgi:hypothetical protein
MASGAVLSISYRPGYWEVKKTKLDKEEGILSLL